MTEREINESVERAIARAKQKDEKKKDHKEAGTRPAKDSGNITDVMEAKHGNGSKWVEAEDPETFWNDFAEAMKTKETKTLEEMAAETVENNMNAYEKAEREEARKVADAVNAMTEGNL